MKPIDTSKLHFRPIEGRDADSLFRGAFSIPQVTQYLQWNTHKRAKETKELVTEMVEMHRAASKYFWAAITPKKGKMVGLCSIRPDEETAWIGFIVFAKEQKNGFGSEIVFAFEESMRLEHQYVSAQVHKENEDSRRLLKKSGWTIKESNSTDTLETYTKRTRR